MADSPADSDAFFHNLLLFGRLLHDLGLEATPDRMILAQEAVQLVGVERRRDFYYTLRASLVRRHEDLLLFDQAFALFWRKPQVELHELPQIQAPDPRMQADAENEEGLPLPHGDPQPLKEDHAEEELPEAGDPMQAYSPRAGLRRKDFADLTPEELAAVKSMIGALTWQAGLRKTRRVAPDRAGLLDMRRSLRKNLQHGGDLLHWSHRAPKLKPRPLVVIADISGSMEPYVRVLLHFIYGLVHGQHRRTDVFLFGTEMTRVSRQLRATNVDRALAEVVSTVRDWSGGTRMGESLRDLNVNWAGRVLRGSPTVLLISDGWDRGDPALLHREMGRLRRFSRRVIWLNPLLSSDQYEPLTRGMQAALPWIDDFLPVHNLISLEQLTLHLNRLDSRRQDRRPVLPLKGAAFVNGQR